MRIRFRLVLFCLSATNILAQDSEEADTLISSDFDNGWVVAFDDKLSTVDGDFANFAGVHGGWLIDHSFLLGGAVYGATNSPFGLDFAYGGVLVEYFFNPNKVVNYSVRGVIGGGGLGHFDNHGHRGRSDVEGFFIAEPEARVTLNVLKPFRIGFGLGYRFVGGDSSRLDLSGPTFAVSFKFGNF